MMAIKDTHGDGRHNTEVRHPTVALVQRDDARFSRKVTKTRDEDLRETAIREVSEELSIDRTSIRVERRLDEYASDEIVEKPGGRKVTYFYVMRSSAEGIPPVKPDVDHRDAR